MIAIDEAISLSINAINCGMKEEELLLAKANNRVLSKNLVSPIASPPFDQSAVDGYALCFHPQSHYEVIGEIQAGINQEYRLEPGQALRIFTGAAVPKEADTIVMQEHVRKEANQITLERKINGMANIRPKGEQIQQGDIALKEGIILNPAGIGYLASLGFTKVPVYSQANIGIIVTGNELVNPGESLMHGQIYESNASMLKTAVASNHFGTTKVYKSKDDLLETEQTIKKALEENDLLLISGGISVGDYDFVAAALGKNGVKEVFHKVKQKPGKPLYFGQLNSKYVFALPGNPAAALSCFYIYVLPFLKKWAGVKAYHLVWKKAINTVEFVKKGDRPQFLKAKHTAESIEILDGQNSSMLHSFALANALCFIPDLETVTVRKGDAIQYIEIS